MTYEEAKRILATARSKKAGKPVANNTRLFERDLGKIDPNTLEPAPSIAVRLHSTDVVTIHPDSSCTLETGGWYTVTTKDRINRFSPARVYSEKSIWYVFYKDAHGHDEQSPFENGILVDKDGMPVFGPEVGSEAVRFATKRVEKLIKAYIDGFVNNIENGGLEEPSAGDCFGCSMDVVDGTEKTMAQEYCGGLGVDHILQHFEESYFVPSLLWRAIRLRGYNQPGYIWQIIAHGDTRMTRDVLRWYFQRIKPLLVHELETTAQMELKCYREATP